MSAPIPVGAGLPPYFGSTPTSINQIIWSPSRVPTTFTSSIQSGDRSQGQVVGTAMMALPFILDYSMGNFNLPIQFPPNSFLYMVSITNLIPFTGAVLPNVWMGRTATGDEIMVVTPLSNVPHAVQNVQVESALPVPGETGVLPPWQARFWVSSNVGTSTAGSALIAIIYGRQ
jgi:hypothetical protein